MNRLIESDPERVRIASEALERVRQGMERAVPHVLRDAMVENSRMTPSANELDNVRSTSQPMAPETIPQAS